MKKYQKYQQKKQNKNSSLVLFFSVVPGVVVDFVEMKVFLEETPFQKTDTNTTDFMLMPQPQCKKNK